MTWDVERDGDRRHGNGKTPVNAPSFRRLSNAAALKRLATVVPILATLTTGVWWLTQRIVVTRAEWEQARIEDAGYRGELTETLRGIRVALGRIEHVVSENADNERKPRRRPK